MYYLSWTTQSINTPPKNKYPLYFMSVLRPSVFHPSTYVRETFNTTQKYLGTFIYTNIPSQAIPYHIYHIMSGKRYHTPITNHGTTRTTGETGGRNTIPKAEAPFSGGMSVHKEQEM